MGKRAKKVWFTVKEFAAATGFSERRVYQFLKSKQIKVKHTDTRGHEKGKAGNRRIRMQEALQDIADVLIITSRNKNAPVVDLPRPRREIPKTDKTLPARAPGSKGATAVDNCGFSRLTLAGAQEEQARQKAAELKMKNDKAMGQLIDVDTAKTQAFDCARITRDAILNVPDRISAELASITDPHGVNDFLTRELTQALEGLTGLTP